MDDITEIAEKHERGAPRDGPPVRPAGFAVGKMIRTIRPESVDPESKPTTRAAGPFR
jgi:hypothetical protein